VPITPMIEKADQGRLNIVGGGKERGERILL